MTVSACISEMELEVQAGHLVNSLRGLQPNWHDIKDAVLCEEFVEIAHIIDESGGDVSQILRHINDDQGDGIPNISSTAHALVKEELEKAWCRDQEILMDVKIGALEEVRWRHEVLLDR